MVYVPASNAGRQDRLVWVDRQGVERPTDISEQDLSMPRLSPDLVRVLIQRGGGNGSQGSVGDATSAA